MIKKLNISMQRYQPNTMFNIPQISLSCRYTLYNQYSTRTIYTFYVTTCSRIYVTAISGENDWEAQDSCGWHPQIRSRFHDADDNEEDARITVVRVSRKHRIQQKPPKSRITKVVSEEQHWIKKWWSPLPSSSGTRSIAFPRVTQALARRRTALHSETADRQTSETAKERGKRGNKWGRGYLGGRLEEERYSAGKNMG